jgi:hypothetical protein
MEQRVNRRKVGLYKASRMEIEPKAPLIPGTKIKNVTRMTPGYCLICNKQFDVLTTIHAESHGYATPEKMIKDKKTKHKGGLKNEDDINN